MGWRFWNLLATDIDLAELNSRNVYLGVDLSSVSDITALVALFPFEEGHYKLLCYFWIPKLTARKSPYREWILRGHAYGTKGNAIDLRAVFNKIMELDKQFHIIDVALDPWGAQKLTTDLEDAGFTTNSDASDKRLIGMSQQIGRVSPPTKELLRLILEEKLLHEGHPIMGWMISNVVVRHNADGDIKVDKEKSDDKVDGVTALVMALDRAMRHKVKKSVYEDRGILILG